MNEHRSHNSTQKALHTKTLATALFLSATALVYASGSHSHEEPTRKESKFESEWLIDYNKALAQSKKTGKPVLMNFTGSTWCPPCIILHNELFSTREFQTYAQDHLILLELDYPDPRMEIVEPITEVQKQNDMLMRMYGVRGFPSIILTNDQGVPFAATGYSELHAKGYIKHLKELIAKK